ncbi:MAG: hypothetical protein AAGA96_16115 [Verrucomicrobiota bacterium]
MMFSQAALACAAPHPPPPGSQSTRELEQMTISDLIPGRFSPPLSETLVGLIIEGDEFILNRSGSCCADKTLGATGEHLFCLGAATTMVLLQSDLSIDHHDRRMAAKRCAIGSSGLEILQRKRQLWSRAMTRRNQPSQKDSDQSALSGKGEYVRTHPE